MNRNQPKQSSRMQERLRFVRPEGDSPMLEEITRDKLEEIENSLGGEFADPRFDHLAKALEILGSINAEEQLDRLRGKWVQVDSLVDYIVDEHHVEFNRALQNYSQVIRLMSESQVLVHQLRKQLVNAEENLSLDTEMLLQLYHRHAMLTEIVNLIEDIEDIVRAESDIDGYAHEKDWKNAVSVLTRAGNKLAREEICHIPAVKSLLPGLRKKSKELLVGILKDVEEEAFKEFSLKGLDSRGARKSRGRRNFSWGSDWVSSNRNLSRTLKFQSMILEDFSPSNILESKAGHRRTDTLSGSGKHDGHVMSSGANSMIIPCIAQLGGIAECLEFIESRAVQKFRESIAQVVNRHAFFQTGDIHGQQASNTASPFYSHRNSDNARQLVSSIFHKCEDIFHSLCVYIKQLTESRIVAPSAGSNLVRDSESIELESKYFGETDRNEVALAEVKNIWNLLQIECQNVIAAAIGLSSQARNTNEGVNLRGQQSSVSRMENREEIQKYPRKSSDSKNLVEASQGIPFSIAEQAGDSDSRSSGVLREKLSMNEIENLITRTLKHENCVLSILPSLYSPTMRLIERCQSFVKELEMEKSERVPEKKRTGRPTIGGLFGSLNSRQVSESEFSNPSLLHVYIVDTLRMEFLPNIYLECQRRTSQMLGGTDAFRPESRLSQMSPQELSPAILPIAQETSMILQDMLKWLSMVPFLAPDLAGILENALGKVIDSLQAAVKKACSDGLAYNLSQDAKLARSMACEPIASLLGGPEAYAASNLGTFLSSAIVSGFSSGDATLPEEMIQLFLNLRPLTKDKTILRSNSDMKRLILLACIGESADHISNSVQSVAQNFGSDALKQQRKNPSYQNKMDQNSVGHSNTSESGGVGNCTAGLLHLANKFRSIAGTCIRCLRIEAMLHALYALQTLTQVGERSHDFEKAVASMSPKLTSMDDALISYLPVQRREYVFAAIPGFCAKIAMKLLPDIDPIGSSDVSLICRSLAAVQPALGGLGCTLSSHTRKGLSQVSGSQPIDKAIKYFSHLSMSIDAIKDARQRDKNNTFTSGEWDALLNSRISMTE